MAEKSTLAPGALNEEILACRKCPRLVEYREKVAREKRRAFRDWTYWGRPVPGFGDALARLLILGIDPWLPTAGNRTGRVFTGDRPSDFRYAALYKAGFANQPLQSAATHGLQLKNAYIAATIRCAPPANKPLPLKSPIVASYLGTARLEILQPRAVLALGKIAWDAYLEVLETARALLPRARRFILPMALKPSRRAPAARLFGVYHPSQQNTQTWRVTSAMYGQVFRAGSNASSEKHSSLTAPAQPSTKTLRCECRLF